MILLWVFPMLLVAYELGRWRQRCDDRWAAERRDRWARDFQRQIDRGAIRLARQEHDHLEHHD